MTTILMILMMMIMTHMQGRQARAIEGGKTQGQNRSQIAAAVLIVVVTVKMQVGEMEVVVMIVGLLVRGVLC